MQEYNPDISNAELQRSYWFVTHYKKIKQLIVVALIVFASITWLGTLWSVLSIYVLAAQHTDAHISGVKQVLAQQSRLPTIAEPIIQSVGTAPVAEGLANAYAYCINPNENWYVRGDLVFLQGENVVRSVPIFLLPSEKRYGIGMGIASSAGTLTASFRNLRWSFISDEEKRVMAEKRDIAIGDTLFIPSDKSGVTRLVPVSKLKFTATNKTISDFWEVRFGVIAKQNGSIVGISEASINSLDSGQKASLETIWFTQLVAADEFDIQPLVDIFDPASYKKKTR